MKKIFLVLFTLSFFICTTADEISVEINTDREISDNNYSILKTKSADVMIEKRIEIPLNIQITDVKYILERNSVSNSFIPIAKPDYATQNNDSFFHEAPLERVSVSECHISNSTVIIVSFFPFLNSDTASAVSAIISYEVNNDESKISRFDRSFYSSKGLNIQKAISDTSTLDMIIITSERFADSLINFCEYENLMGIKTSIMLVESIYSLFAGTDKQEKIRNYIKVQYLSKGIRFVLLAGGANIVPVRMSYSEIYFHQGYIPTDLYYADMNGGWNMDKDGDIGELMSDIEDGFPDITVSRLPFKNEIELSNLLNKFYGYIYLNNPSRIKSFLHCGASLLSDLSDGNGQLMTEMLVSMDNIKDFSNTKLYAPTVDTFNTPSSYIGDLQLNRANFTNEISAGHHLINHIDHSSEFYLGTGNLDTRTEYNSQDTNLISANSSVYSIMFTMGCSANGYDRESASNGLLLSTKSSIANIVGFTRTGWTSSQSLMNRYWKMITDDSTMFVGDAFRFALIDNCIYFRVAVNMIGFATMPIYTKEPVALLIESPDSISSRDTLVILVADQNGPVQGALVAVVDKDSYIRIFTDASGRAVVLPGSLSGKIKIGASKKNYIPVIDSVFCTSAQVINLSNACIKDDLYISIDIANVTDTSVLLTDIHIGGDDSLFFFNRDIKEIRLMPGEIRAEECTLYYYKRPKFTTVKKIGYEISSPEFTFSDSLALILEAEHFYVNGISFPKNDTPFIETIVISKSVSDTLTKVSAKITSLSSEISVIDSFFDISLWEDSLIQLTDIKIKKYSQSFDAKNAVYSVAFSHSLRTDTFIVRGLPVDTDIAIYADVELNSITLYMKQTDYSTEIFKSDPLSDAFFLVGKLSAGEIVFKDTAQIIGTNRYFAVFRDNLGRIVDTSSVVSADVYVTAKKSLCNLSGSFYGTIDGKRYFARSSMNSADLDFNGVKEIVTLADDGRLWIMNDKLEDITPFTLYTTPHNETTPVIGDIDMNGSLDIVIGNGSAKSDTSAFVIFNPMLSSRRIEAICSLGVLTASPVIANIDDDLYNEILLGSSKYFTVLKHDLSKYSAFTKAILNVWGIALSEENRMIFLNDYYGNIYSYDFEGNQRSGFPFKTGLVTTIPLILTDIDSDTRLDVIIGTASGKLFVINENGQVRGGFPHSCLSGIYQTPRLFDIGNDHNLEMIFSDINGNIYVINNSGARISFLSTGVMTNTYNEMVIYDFNGDYREDFVFVMRNGNIAVYNQQLAPLFQQFVRFGEIVTTSPIVIDFKGEMKPSLVVRDYAGEIFKIDTYSETSAAGGIAFSKTLYDSRNTSFVSGFLLKSENEDKPAAAIMKKDFVSIKNTLVRNTVEFLYLSSNEDLSVNIVNILGQNVSEFLLSSKEKSYGKNLQNLPSGEYFVSVQNSRNTLLKKKILVVR
ncbi:MAG: C25 family cysteine peptidase [bacterium]